MTLQEELADIQYRLRKLETKSKGKPSEDLKLAAKMTLEVLKEFREGAGKCMEDEGYDDYRRVCSTIPILERALKTK